MNQFHLMISDYNGDYDESFDTPQEAYAYGARIVAEIEERYPSDGARRVPRVIYGEEIEFESLFGRLD